MKILRSGLVGLIALLGLGTMGGCYGGYYAAHPGYYSTYPGGYYPARPGYYRPYRGGYSYYRGRPGYYGGHRVAPPPAAPYRGTWRGPGHFGGRGYGHRGHWR